MPIDEFFDRHTGRWARVRLSREEEARQEKLRRLAAMPDLSTDEAAAAYLRQLQEQAKKVPKGEIRSVLAGVQGYD